MRRIFGNILLFTRLLMVLFSALVLSLTSFRRAVFLILWALVVERGDRAISSLSRWVLRAHVVRVVVLIETRGVAHDRSRAGVLVGIETTQSNNVSQTLNLNHWHLVLHGREVHWTDVLSTGRVRRSVSERLLLVVVVLLVLVVLEFLRHWRQSHSFGQVGKWINQLSLLQFVVVEGTTISELAFASLLPVLAGFSLVVGMYSSKRGLSEVLGQRLHPN